MTDKIYGGYRPATIATTTIAPDYVYPSGERLEGADGAWANERLGAKLRTDETPIEDLLHRTNLTIDRLNTVVAKLYNRLEPYIKTSNPGFASDVVGYPPPSSALGQAIYALEERLRALEYQLEDLHQRVER